MSHSRLASPRATIDVLEAHDLYTRKSLGQHFLIDDNVVGRILGLARLTGDEAVVEVGPGIGTLTIALCAHAAAVVAVETDERLLEVLADTTRDCANLKVVHADAVTVPLAKLATDQVPPAALVANLPYGVAATVVLRFFEQLPSLRFAVVMVQAEVADRMQASPGTKDYGAYTVKLALHARATHRFTVPKTCFLPPPRVDSAVIRLEREAAVAPELARATAWLAEAAFAQRRKTLRNSLRATVGLSDAVVDELLQEAGVDGRRRAETLSLDEYLRLGRTALGHGLLP